MRRLLTIRWLARHALAVGLIVVCSVLARWQLGRAAGGNTLSWAYAVQWPLFGAFVAVLWAREVRAEVGDRGRDRPRPGPAPLRPLTGPAPLRPLTGPEPLAVRVPDDDPQLAAYNAYLAWLAANPDRRPADYPG